MVIDTSRLAGVYLLTPDTSNHGFDRVIDIVRHVLDAGVRVVQYREKTAEFAVQFERTTRLRAVTRAAGALLIVNDDAELAVSLDADGVHLGRDDGDVAAARRRMGRRLLGVSCYNQLDRARRAINEGADAVAFGSVFASRTKPEAVRASLELLSEARTSWPQRRVIAIGGIDTSNIAAVAEAGAHAAAVLDAVFGARDPARMALELVRRFEQGRLRHEEQRAVV
ncbi:MAG: thiamine phosphate synthase [Burkholderiaceae bacterium]